MIFDEQHEKPYLGNYRAEVVSLDISLKNGVYKVKVYPMMATLQDEFLPRATSLLTNRYKHIQLVVGDWVWVFFENGDVHFPVIFDICNIKTEYPTASLGTYGTYDKFKFGDITCEISESNDKITLKKTGKFEISIDSNGNVNIVAGDGTKIGTQTITLNAPKVIVNSPQVSVGDGLDGYIVTSPTPGLSTVASGMPIQSSTKIKASL